MNNTDGREYVLLSVMIDTGRYFMVNRFLFLYREASIGALFFLPALLFLNRYRFRNTQKTFLYFIFCYYLSGMYAAAGLPNVIRRTFYPRLNLIPFQYMFSDWENTLLNLILFMPLGLLLPILWRPFQKLWRLILLGLGTSLLIELLQLFTYRATDINDLITNTLGSVLGYGAFRILRLRSSPDIQENHTHTLPILVLIVILAMYFLQPLVSRLLYLLCC